MQGWFGEIRFAARRLGQAPGFTAGVVATLALGMGATTAIFSLASAVLLRPLPYPEPERLVSAGQAYEDGLAGVGEPKFLFWRERARSFEALACYSSFGGASGNLAGGAEPQFVKGLRVSLDYFRALGVLPDLGRPFTQDEDQPGGQRVAVISDGLWRRAFGEDREIVGRQVTLNDTPVTIVGVMPRGFKTDAAADLLLPMQARAGANHDPNATVVGRLKPGVSIEQARAEMKNIAAQYRAAFPGHMAEGESIDVRSYQLLFSEGPARVLWILLGAVSFLLLIACVNVAHLQLSRAAARRREFAVRAALGGGVARMARLVILESLITALIAGVLGTWVAAIGTRLLVGVLPPGYLPEVAVVSFDGRVLAFAFLASVATGLVSGLIPVLELRKLDVSAMLKDGGDKGGTGRTRMRAILVATEIALSLALVAGAGVLARSLANLLQVEPGFDARKVITFQIAPAGPRYDTAAKTAAFYREAIDRVTAVPGVEAAGITNKLPLDWQFNMPVFLADRPDQFQNAQVRMVSSAYFRAMGIPLRDGRGFTAGDDAGAAPVAMVNQAFARRFLPGRSPLSSRLSVGRGLEDPAREVMGVVGDARQNGLGAPAPPMVFVPAPQVSDRLLRVFRTFTNSHLVVRAGLDTGALTAAVKLQLTAIDPSLAISNVISMEDLTARSVSPQRFNVILVSLFGLIALLLALSGVYGVMAYSVERQTREIGVRVALGAGATDVRRLVLGQSLRLSVTGLIAGAALFAGLSGILESQLYEVSARDPLVIAGATLLLLVTALLASYLPARRAAALDPIESLRAE